MRDTPLGSEEVISQSGGVPDLSSRYAVGRVDRIVRGSTRRTAKSTAGAGLKFSERGSHELKGLPGNWDLFAASL